VTTKTTATNKKVRELMIALNANTLIPRPYFQRRLVWTARHKQLFIKTVLEGYPFPEIFLCDGDVDLDTGEGKQLVVDGQQRITTLHQYFTASDDLRLGDIPAYATLSNPEKQQFLDYDVVVRDLGRLTDQEVLEVFNRMNSTNYGLNAMEVNNARFNGPLKLFAEEVSKWPIFEDHRVFAVADIRRMSDVRWALTMIITLLAGYFNRDSEHENYLRRFNDDFPQYDEVRSRLEKTISLIERLDLGDHSRVWQKNDLFTLIVEVYKKSPDRLQDEDALANSLTSFYAAVDAVSEGKAPSDWGKEAAVYQQAVFSGSNERARRLRRAESLRPVLEPHFAAIHSGEGIEGNLFSAVEDGGR